MVALLPGSWSNTTERMILLPPSSYKRQADLVSRYNLLYV
uniref:Uncharacterized protein n=1 Tax=Anguilla anguilla TaxID=7936 RepID=A0A0E9VTW3_ANGAN